MTREITSTEYRLAMLQSLRNWNEMVARVRPGAGRIESQAFTEHKAPCAFAMSLLAAGAAGIIDPSRALDYEQLVSRDPQQYRAADRIRDQNASDTVGGFFGRVADLRDTAVTRNAFHRGNDGYTPQPGDLLATDGRGHVNMMTNVVELSPGRWQVTYADNFTMYYPGTRENRAIIHTSERGRGYVVEESGMYDSHTGALICHNHKAPEAGGTINVIDMATVLEHSPLHQRGVGAERGHEAPPPAAPAAQPTSARRITPPTVAPVHAAPPQHAAVAQTRHHTPPAPPAEIAPVAVRADAPSAQCTTAVASDSYSAQSKLNQLALLATQNGCDLATLLRNGGNIPYDPSYITNIAESLGSPRTQVAATDTGKSGPASTRGSASLA